MAQNLYQFFYSNFACFDAPEIFKLVLTYNNLMTRSFTTKQILAFCAGFTIGAGVLFILYFTVLAPTPQAGVPYPVKDEYHVHADFHIVVLDTLVDLSDDQFQTTSHQTVHPDLHLHDNVGTVKHIHAEHKTFVEFLDSLGITLTNSCITLDETYCTDETNVLHLYVDGTQIEDIGSYVPVDDEQILVYYGPADETTISSYLNAVPDDACYYSGTCLERGVAPPESCGLTCEL